MEMAEVHIRSNREFVGRSLRDVDFAERGLIVVAVKQRGHQLSFPPDLDRAIEKEDSLVMVGRRESLEPLIGDV